METQPTAPRTAHDSAAMLSPFRRRKAALWAAVADAWRSYIKAGYPKTIAIEMTMKRFGICSRFSVYQILRRQGVDYRNCQTSSNPQQS